MSDFTEKRKRWRTILGEIENYKKETPVCERNKRGLFLVYQRIRKRDRGFGSSPLKVGLLLYTLVSLLKPRVCVELGTFFGWTAFCMGTAMNENKQGKLFTIDKNKEYQKYAKRLIVAKGLKKHVQFINALSQEKRNLLKTGFKIDLLYIDSEHKYLQTKSELLLYKNKIRKGGLIIFHDYCPRFAGVLKAANEILDEKSWHKIPYYGALGVAIFRNKE